MSPPTDPTSPPGDPSPTVLDSRIWIDGCWDFFHHGHAGAMLQARQLGTELYIGVHSDESILENKGPTVMSLPERMAAVDACRWVSKSIPKAPYVTDLDWITHYGCRYVVHGDDITSDSSGEDCYRFVKQAGRFKVVKRTPSISTTDLVGRMLLCTRTHFIKDLQGVLDGKQGDGEEGKTMLERMRAYATDETAARPGVDVWFWEASKDAKTNGTAHESGNFRRLLDGIGAKPGQSIVYVDGGFDLFSSGHIEFLRLVVLAAEEEAKQGGWKEEYSPVYVVAGIHDDEVINHWKGVNYPIMNIYERGMCLLQCKYVNAVVFGAPFAPSKQYLTTLPFGTPNAVYHGPTTFMPLTYDPYSDPKTMGIYKEIGHHDFEGVNAGTITQRILKSRELYEERQRKKGLKSDIEAAAKERELMEEEQKKKETGTN